MKNNIEKERLLIKREFNMIFENHKKINYKTLFETITKKSNLLHKRGFNQILIEESITDLLSTLKGGGKDTITEMVLKYFLEKLGVEGRLLNFLMIAGGNLEFSQLSKFLSPLKNCEDISDWLFDSLIEWFTKEGLDELDLGEGWISGILRNTLLKALNDIEFVNELKKKYIGLFCTEIKNVIGDEDISLSGIISKIKNEFNKN